MSQTSKGGYLWIINATSKTLKKISEDSQNMSSWNFSDVPSQSLHRFHVKFNQSESLISSAVSGEAEFQLCGTDDTFQLLVRWPHAEGECGLKIDWRGTTRNGSYAVFPPTLQGETFAKLGWIHNGSLSLLIMEKGTASSLATVHLAAEDSIVSGTTCTPRPQCGPWMETYSDVLGRLTLTEMTLPGTHDSGTHNPVSVLGKLWIKTQSLTLSQQLSAGIRVLDLRIGQTSPGNYIICHDTWCTSYSLAQALKEVTDFVDGSSKEVVVLDFHRFVALGRGDGYDYAQLKEQIASALSGYCVSASHAGSTLATIWSSGSHRERVVVAWNAVNPDPYMWPGVNQRWYSKADSLSSLYECIHSDTKDPPRGMWATCAFMASSLTHNPRSNALKSEPTMTNWYFGGSMFCERANIISVDFFDEFSNVVQASIIGSLLKAGKSQQNHTSS